MIKIMELIKPTKQYEDSWLKGMREFDEAGDIGFWNLYEGSHDLDKVIEQVNQYSKGESLPDGWVPATTYWLIDEGEFVAHVNIRHALNERLKRIGGNIGYAVVPSCRRRGYGEKILGLALLKAKEIGLKKILLTCDDANSASQKIIERNGGVLDSIDKFEGEIDGLDKFDGMMMRKYWIDL